jgi:hypothetical protein
VPDSWQFDAGRHQVLSDAGTDRVHRSSSDGCGEDASISCRIAIGLLIAMTVCALCGALALPAAAATSSTPEPPIGRVLIVSLPGISWPDLEQAPVPHLRRLLDQSAIGALVTRMGGRQSAGVGYLAIGAGSRALSDELLVGQAFEPDEMYGGTRAADVFAQRTGLHVDHGLLHLGAEALSAENASGRFDPRLGALGDALAAAGWRRAVIANGDGAQPVVDAKIAPYQRSAVAALMTSDGVVPEGEIGRELLVDDHRAPFGLRLDDEAVLRAFDTAWQPRSVVLVEASDLLRADLYGEFTTSEQLRTAKTRALARTDALVGQLVGRLSPNDAVVVLGPTPGRSGGLATMALRAPGVEPGLLRSASSRRNGVVFATDVAPTILHLLGIAKPARMEGSVMQVHTVADPTSRVGTLASLSRDSVLRDTHNLPVSIVTVVLGGVLAAGTALALWRFPRRRELVELASLAVLGFLAATYVAGPLHVLRHGNNAYWAFLFAFGCAFAVICKLLGRGRPYAPLIIALAATVALHVADLLTGARLEFNTVFGYTATVGIRTAGESNLTFAQVGAAVVLVVALAIWRAPTRSVVYAAVATLALTVAVMVAPQFGDDFGAALAAFPAFALLAWLLLGHRVRIRTVVLLAVGLVTAALVVGFVDLLRPPNDRTHIGRFFSQVGREGVGGLVKVLHRKADTNFASFSTARLMWLVPIVALFVTYLCLSKRTRLTQMVRETPVFGQALAAFLVLMLLGYALNDSGIAIPALMALELECVVAYVALRQTTSPAGSARHPGTFARA